MKVLKQDKEYNCGVYALQFLLSLFEINKSIEELEKDLGTTEKDGASHTDIKRVVNSYGLQFTEFNNADVQNIKYFIPVLINYQWDGDGHYSVVLSSIYDHFIIYNPGNGEIEKLSYEYLKKNWKSERYGNGWFLSINSVLT